MWPIFKTPILKFYLPAFNKNLTRKYNHDGVAERFEDPAVRMAVEADSAMVEAFNKLLKPLERQIEKIACEHDPNNFYLLKTIPGVGQIPALVILYEVHDVSRFMKLYWLTQNDRSWNEAKSSATVNYTVANDTWTTITIPVGASSFWVRQPITKWRLDVDSANHGARFLIDYIRVLHQLSAY